MFKCEKNHGIKNFTYYIMNIEFFENRPMRFGKYKGKTLKWIYDNDFNYAVWMSKNFTKPKGDYKLFCDFVKKEIEENTGDYIERKIYEDYKSTIEN